ncbi:MAG: hypothetical protein J6R44_01725, partial [Clostridia bacterium]|nr:hypothetical protein [Clostridia bacterium]
MKRNLTHKILLLVVLAALVVALFACSPRPEDDFANDGNVIVGGETTIDKEVTLVQKAKAEKLKEHVKDAVDNYTGVYA